MHWSTRALLWLSAFPLPLLALSQAQHGAFGRFSVDLAGHLWTGWSAARGPLTRSPWIGFPDGVDLMPIVGGWLDVWLVGLLSPALGLVTAYNVTCALYGVVAGLGGQLLARSIGASALGAGVAGLLLQLDPFILHHLMGGRPEQVGLGFVALALGAALLVWRGALRPLWAGLAGALMLFVSWELSLLCALCLAFLSPFLPRDAPPGAWGRWGRAALACTIFAGPWVFLFLSRASGVRAMDEGDFALETAWRASVGLLGWLSWGSVRPGALVMLSLLFLPWTLRAEDRRLGVGALLGLLGAWVLALGPSPGLWAPGPRMEVVWAPFVWLQSFPVLGWFHWPDRLLCVFSLAGVCAVSRIIDCVEYIKHKSFYMIQIIVAIVFLTASASENQRSGRWPVAEYEPLARAPSQALGALPEEGAVLDLPIQPAAVQHLNYQIEQLGHERPILFHMALSHLQDPSLAARVAEDPLLSWFRALMEPGERPARQFTEADLAGLRSQGFRFVVLHKRGWPPPRWKVARESLTMSLGEPFLRDGTDWLCWRLEVAP
ncbi:MAG: hypothetical protein IPI35_32015 [Deltaproteobacteria bacterium]|nr:hypothetical protein [Deltaproteobacteria bacterium]